MTTHTFGMTDARLQEIKTLLLERPVDPQGSTGWVRVAVDLYDEVMHLRTIASPSRLLPKDLMSVANSEEREDLEAAIQADLMAPLCASCEAMHPYDKSPESCSGCAAIRVAAVLATVPKFSPPVRETLPDTDAAYLRSMADGCPGIGAVFTEHSNRLRSIADRLDEGKPTVQETLPEKETAVLRRVIAELEEFYPPVPPYYCEPLRNICAHWVKKLSSILPPETGS